MFLVDAASKKSVTNNDNARTKRKQEPENDPPSTSSS